MKHCPNAIHLVTRYYDSDILHLFDLLLEAGADINSVSSLANGKHGCLIHNAKLCLNPILLRHLEQKGFNFCKFINFRNKDERTPFLQFCNISAHFQGFQNTYFITHIWQKYAFADLDTNQLSGLEVDNKGDNGLHLQVRHTPFTGVYLLKFILETAFFPNNNKKKEKGSDALNQQNLKGETPLHEALYLPDNETAADVAKISLKYDCDVARKYNQYGCLPIHVACMNNNWKALVVLMQNKVYGEHSDDINETILDGTHTALELSIESECSKCVQILCKSRNICIDAVLFRNTIELNI